MSKRHHELQRQRDASHHHPPRAHGLTGTLYRWGFMVVFLVAAGLSFDCVFDDCGGGEKSAGPTLVVARARDATTLDPARATDVDSADVLFQIFETLVTYPPDSFDVQPCLAVRWQKSTDLKTWTFHLRKDVKFHDGSHMDADAVVYSFDRQRQGGVRQAEFFYWNGYYGDIIKDVKKTGRYRVKFELTRPFAPFLASLAMFPVSIVSPKSCRKLGDRFAQQPVGTGPFKFVAWDRSAGRIKMRRFDDYWGPRSSIEKLVFRRITDSRQRVLALQSGAAHVIRNVDPWALQMVRLHPDLRVSITRGNTVGFLALNTQKPPFNNPTVRWAVNRAIRKHVFVKLIYQGLAEPAIGPLPPVFDWAYNKKIKTYPYDEKRARRELAATGYKDDPATRPKLYVMDTPRPYIPRPVMASHLIARDLEEIGMPVDLVVQPFKKHKESITRGDHHLAMYGWVGDNGDPDNFLSTLLGPKSPLNISFWRHSEYARLVEAARETRKKSSRARYYKKAQKIFANQAPWIPLAHTKMVVALRRDVQNFELGPTSILSLKGVSLK